MPLGSFKNNYAHSYLKFGLRIKVHAPRKYPCADFRNDKIEDPWKENPPIPAVYENFVTWKNYENGVQGEYLGWVVFKNMKIADSKQSAFVIQVTNYSSYETTKIENALIVGKSYGNPSNDSTYMNTAGILTSHNENLIVSNIRFHNFGNNMAAFHSCAFCFNTKKRVSGAITTFIKGIKFYNVKTKLKWISLKNDIFLDIDGSLTGKGEKSWIAGFFPHLINPNCKRDQSIEFNDSIICNSKVEIRRILFTGFNPLDLFLYKQIKVFIFLKKLNFLIFNNLLLHRFLDWKNYIKIFQIKEILVLGHK